MRKLVTSVLLSFAGIWSLGCGAKPLVVDLTIYDARTSTASMGNITGTSALFRVSTDTQLMTMDGSGIATVPASTVDVTVFGTPIGTIHGIISIPGIQVVMDPNTGGIDIRMPLIPPGVTQGISAIAPALNGYRFESSVNASPIESGATYVFGLPVSSRLFWTPDVEGVGSLGAGGIPPIANPPGTLAISILEPAPVPTASPMVLAMIGLLILISGWAVARRHGR